MYFSDAAKLAMFVKPLPRIKRAASPNMRIMAARACGILAQIHSGGAGNAGGIVIAPDDRSVFVTAPNDGARLLGKAQEHGLGIGDAAFVEGRADMAVDMTKLYPEQIRFCQRTLMFDSEDGSSRIVDMIESSARGDAVFSFVTPYEPREGNGEMKIGPLALAYDGMPIVTIDKLPATNAFDSGLYRICLTYELITGSNVYQFNISGA
jgi:hypothetical protein